MMDPNEALRRIREILERRDEMDQTDNYELTELMVGLDEWLTNGGFLPEAWAVNRT